MTKEPEAAVAILRARQPRDSVLLIRRSEREDDSWSGHWSFPGGRRDTEDGDLLETALRELEEECGIRLERGTMAEALPPLMARRRHPPYILVAPFVFSIECELPTRLDPKEAVEAFWVPLSHITDPAQHRLRPVPHRPARMLFPAVDLNSAVVPLWGFTYRLIMAWLGLEPSSKAGSPENTTTPFFGNSACTSARKASSNGAPAPGFRVASRVLEFLLAHGLQLEEDWREGSGEIARFGPIVKVATVEGTIPVAPLLEHFSRPGEDFPSVNLLEADPARVLISGLGYEEYLIRARSAPPLSQDGVELH